MNLLVQMTNVAKLETNIERAIVPYAKHIRSLYIYADPKFKELSAELEEYTVKFLNKCPNVTSLGLFFQSHDIRNIIEWRQLRDAVVRLVEEGELSSIGFYSQYVLTHQMYLEYHFLIDSLIGALSESEKARTRIKHFDFAVFLIPAEVHNKIRANFPNLEALTMQLSFRGPPGGYGDPTKIGKWVQLDNLTTLQFVCCAGAYAADVPDIVSFFPALRELLVAECGAPVHKETGPHEEGWHLKPDALCNTHKPLEWFHISFMRDWEIRALGLIPTKTLILTHEKPSDFLNELKKDNHLFPEMQVLRLEESIFNEEWGVYEKVLEEVCTSRNLSVIKDAKSIRDRTDLDYSPFY
jgi:hypothetical protein